MKHLGFLAALSMLLLSGCGKQASEPATQSGDKKLRVVTTIGMITDLVKRIGGERVEVEALMGAGVDPHLYKPSEGDVSRLSEADIVFYNGLHLEAKMGEVLERMAKTHKTVAVTEQVDKSLLLTPPEFEGQHDPHVWFDVTLWSKAAEQIRDTLKEVDPAHSDDYTSMGETVLRELVELHEYVKSQAAKLPEDQRQLVTAHDAFNYFGRAYGFTVHGLQGISTASEAGTADVDRLATLIAEKKIPAIFVESSVPKRNIQAVQEAVRSKGFEVKIGGELFSDAMGDAGTPEGTYDGMIRHNIDTIVNALLVK